jgi:hypothetical protein
MFSSIRTFGRLKHFYLTCIIVFGMTALAACGGNGNEDKNSATITSPADGAIYTYGDAITFTGSGTDDDEEELTGESLVWTSDIEDEVGTGTDFTLEELSWGDHAITLTATDGNGKTASDTIYISVKAWAHPVDLSDSINPYGQDVYGTRAAMDGNGDTVIVWAQNDGSNDQIFKSEYRDGVWTHPVGLDDNISPDGEDAGDPRVAMDENGNAVITWHQSDGSNNQIFMSEYRDGAWSHPTGLDDNFSPDGEDAQYQEVTMDNNGNALITWQQYYSGYSQIFKSEYRNGTWDHPDDLADNISPDGEDALSPEIAMDNSGNAIITWQQSDSAYTQIFKSEYRNGTWDHPDGLADNISPDGNYAYYPQVAMDNNGNAIIAWFQSDNGNIAQIYLSDYRNGTWTHPADLSDNISPYGEDATSPWVAMGNNGDAVITWSQSDGSYDRVFLSEYR